MGVSLNLEEQAVIEAKAKAAGLSVAVYLRQAGLGARLGNRVSEQAYHQLSRIGVNLNQLARVASATGRLPERELLGAMLDQVLDLRRQL